MYRLYSDLVFSLDVAKQYLSEDIYNKYLLFRKNLLDLDPKELNELSISVYKWAKSKNVRFYKHVFFPINKKSSGKEISFIELKEQVIESFTYKDLVKDELDGSSFLNGGLRDVSKATGYLIIDHTRDLFINDGVLNIPSLFYSFNDESLDERGPLIKSNKLLNSSLVELMNVLGYKDIKQVKKYLGVEQEYYLIKKEHYLKRLDLKMLDRTIFGDTSIIKSVLRNHYMDSSNGVLNKINNQVEQELIKLAIPYKVRHSECGLQQEEVVCIYEDELKTCFDNHLLQEILIKISEEYDYICIFNEKPFKDLPGSGKHNNFSLVTDTEVNLFSYSSNVEDSLVFLLIVSCLIKGINTYQSLLQFSVSSYSNDLRLGEMEAPKNVISIYLGEEVENLINALFEGQNDFFNKKMNINKSNYERNRTSPFAFCGNRFEFRSVGANQSLELINTMINVILSSEIQEVVMKLKNNVEIKEIIKENLLKNKEIIFNGNSYSSSWKCLSKNRGFNEFTNSYEILKALKEEKNIKILSKILTEKEIEARYQIYSSLYIKELLCEVKVSLQLIRREIYPSFTKQIKELCDLYEALNNIGEANHDLNILISKYNNKLSNITKLCYELEEDISYHKLNIEKIKNKLSNLRILVDDLEQITDHKFYPLPTYIDMLLHNY